MECLPVSERMANTRKLPPCVECSSTSNIVRPFKLKILFTAVNDKYENAHDKLCQIDYVQLNLLDEET